MPNLPTGQKGGLAGKADLDVKRDAIDIPLTGHPSEAGVYEIIDPDGTVWAIKDFHPSPTDGALCFTFDYAETADAELLNESECRRLEASTFRRVVAPDGF